MEALAIKNDNYDYMTGAIKCPKTLEPIDTNKADVAAREKQRLEWHYGSLIARSDIVLTMKPSELTHVRHCKYANEVWAKLQAVYQSRGPARKTTLLKKILFAKMAENEDMSQHIVNFINTVDQLESMDFNISEDICNDSSVIQHTGHIRKFPYSYRIQRQAPHLRNFTIQVARRI